MFFGCSPCCGVRFCRCKLAYPLESNLYMNLDVSSFTVDSGPFRDQRRYWSDALGSCSVADLLEEVQSIYWPQTSVVKDPNGFDSMLWYFEEISSFTKYGNTLAFNCRSIGETFSFSYSKNIALPSCLGAWNTTSPTGSLEINSPSKVNILLTGYVTGNNSTGSFCELFTDGSTGMYLPSSRITIYSNIRGNYTWAAIRGTASLSISNLP